MTKQVTEFRFQRKTDTHDVKMNDGEECYKALAKLLRAARTQRAIVCAGPSRSHRVVKINVKNRRSTTTVRVTNCRMLPPLGRLA